VQWNFSALVFGIAALAAVIVWLWSTDPGPSHPDVDIGGGIRLPVYMTGPSSHSWWAMIVLIVVSAMAFGSLIFSYLYLWTVNRPGNWLPGPEAVPDLVWPFASAALYITSSILIAVASRALKGRERSGAVPVLILVAVALVVGAIAIDLLAQRQAGFEPHQTSYAAVIYSLAGFQAFFVAVIAIMGLYTAARWVAGLLNRARRVTFDNTMLLWHYTVIQGLVGLLLVYGFPLAGGVR
jgi:cytochrome c oxidase subunit I+III